VPDDRDALLLLALIQQNFGSLCRELATMAGLIDLIRAGRFQKGENILFLHTGGSTALFGYQETFAGAREP
jgi:hypothetical protein